MVVRKYFSRLVGTLSRWASAFLQRVKTFWKKVVAPPPIPPRFYRSSKVWMLYAKEVKRYTPEPFAEMRVFVVHDSVKDWQPELEKALKKLRWIFKSIFFGMNEITYEVEGEENSVEIDKDEADKTLATTGLKKPRLNRVYRYVAFFGDKRRIRAEYNEHKIRTIVLPARAREYDEWKRKKYAGND